jgi:hypothetical protein
VTAARTLVVGWAALAVYLVLVLATDGVGLGDDGRGKPSWPGLLEDDFDRHAYQQRGRWIASGGRPYLDEFSEYPQVSTWLMGLPYLLFDHGVVRGEPFGAKERLRALYVRAGKEAEVDAVFRQLVREPFSPSASAAPDSLVQQRAAGLAGAAGVEITEARTALDDAWRESSAYVEELKRNRKSYGDRHHLLMAAWMAVLLALSVALLRELGDGPAWALLLLLPSSLYFGFNRFDVVVTTLVAGSLLLQLRGRGLLAAFVLGLAVMTKWFPIALAPLYCAYAFRRARRTQPGEPLGPLLARTWIGPGLVLSGVVFACLALTWVWGEGGWEAVRFVFDWHAEVRQPNKSSLLMALTSDQQWGLFDASARPTLEKVFKLLQLAPGFALALLPLRTPRALIAACLAATLCAVLFSEFFSPQWVLWTTALSLLLAPRWRRFAVLTVALEVLLWLQMCFHSHVYAAGLVDGAMSPTWTPFWVVNHVRIGLMAVFLAVSVATMLSEVRRPATAVT